jgi:Domain of unknown function (DUF4124)
MPRSAARWPRGAGIALALALWAAVPARAQPAPRSQSIYSCVDAAGKKLTSDRPIAECNAREQRVLNSDGSVKEVRRPTPTADERSEAEARERDLAADRARRLEEIRGDRNLQNRFPNETAHRKARESDLETVRKSLRLSQARLAALAAERKPLNDESEFYVGKPLPLKLKQALDANDASVDAQKSLVQNQQLEILRIDQRFDAELARLRQLWAGRQPGTMGSLAGSPGASAPRR